MKTFLEYLTECSLNESMELTFEELLVETKIENPRQSLIAIHLIKNLGGDPDGAINLTDLLEKDKGVYKSESTLRKALEDAIKSAEKEGARKASLDKTRLSLMRSDSQEKLVSLITNILHATITKEEEIEKKKSRKPWEDEKRKGHTRKGFKRPDQAAEDNERD